MASNPAPAALPRRTGSKYATDMTGSRAARIGEGLTALPGALVRPGPTARALSQGGFTAPAAAVVAVGLLWAGLSAALAVGGHRPSGPSPFGAAHYAVQAGLLVPLLVAGWLTYARVAHLGRPGPWRVTAKGLAAPYAGPVLFLFVLPDLAAYLAVGFEGLAATLRVTGPLLFFGAWLTGGRALSTLLEVGPGAAAARALAGLLAQAILLAPVLR